MLFPYLADLNFSCFRLSLFSFFYLRFSLAAFVILSFLNQSISPFLHCSSFTTFRLPPLYHFPLSLPHLHFLTPFPAFSILFSLSTSSIFRSFSRHLSPFSLLFPLYHSVLLPFLTIFHNLIPSSLSLSSLHPSSPTSSPPLSHSLSPLHPSSPASSPTLSPLPPLLHHHHHVSPLTTASPSCPRRDRPSVCNHVSSSHN